MTDSRATAQADQDANSPAISPELAAALAMIKRGSDELLIEAPTAEVDATIQVVKKIMESVVTLKVPLKVALPVDFLQ